VSATVLYPGLDARDSVVSTFTHYLGIDKIIVQEILGITNCLLICDVTWSIWKMKRPKILLWLGVHSLPWEHVY
jgi:hypothetical protein